MSARSYPFICALSLAAAGCGFESLATPDAGEDLDAGHRDGSVVLPDAGADADTPPDAAPRTPLINEFVINISGADTHEYVEVIADPGLDVSHLSVLMIESSIHQQPGQIELVVPLVGSTNETGHAVTPYQVAAFQNTSMTLALVADFSGAVGDDVDADDDGAIDNPVWSALLDSVALDDGGGTDIFQSDLIFPPDPGIVSGASRIPDGVDTGEPGDWVANDIDGSGLPCSGCEIEVPISGEAHNTPGAPNRVEP
jgi:hypothetical protein